MTYAKFLYVRGLTEEINKLEKLLEEVSEKASGTKTGGKNAVKRDKITKLVKELKLERTALISEINAWFDSINLNSSDRKIFSEYFFKAKGKKVMKDFYGSNNIHSDLKLCIYGFRF